MKTINQVKGEISEIRNELSKLDKDFHKSKYNKLTKEIKRLYSLQLYLEMEPEEIYVSDDLRKLKQRKKSIDEGFENWKMNFIPTKLGANKKSIFQKEMGLKDIEAQIKNLSYLLS